MAIHWITFRLEDATVGGRSYTERYNALVETVNQHATDAWDEPTSFWLVASSSTRAQLAASIKKAIAPSHDLVLIGSMDTLGATLVGNAKKLPALKRLIPSLLVA